MGKRSNEHGQLRKEEYEALSSKDSSVGGKNFSRASIGELKNRRIVKVRTPSRTPSETKDATPSENEKPSNPWASVSFGKPSGVAAPFSFSSNSKKPSNDTNLFSFGSSNSKVEPSILRPKSSGTETEKEKSLRKLNSDFRAKRKEQGNNINHLVRDVDLYLRYYRLICLKNRPAANIQSSATTTTTKPLVNKLSGNSTNNAVSSTAVKVPESFDFGSTTSNDKKSETMSSQSQPPTSFSFGNSTTRTDTDKNDTVQASAKPSFSLGPNTSTTSTALSGTPAPAEESTKASDAAVSDPDWETEYKVDTVKFYALEDDTWKSFSKGPLQLQSKKSDSSKKRIVIRDANIGKVLLNVMITGLKFAGRKKNNKAYINFVALRDAKKGTEQMMLQCFPKQYDDLLAKLQKMSSP